MPKLKLTDDGQAIVEDGKIVMIGDDGAEFSFDVEGAHTTIAELRSEAGTWRKKLRTAESDLARYEGIEDPDAARRALEDVKALGDDHKAALDGLRTEMTTAYEGKIKDRDTKISELQGTVFKMKVSDKFFTSDVAKGLIYDPGDAAIIFGQNFEFGDDGEIVGKLDGKVIYSRENPGQPAGFDEALTTMIDARPNKNAILKSSAKGGTGSPPGNETPGEPTSKSSQQNISEGLAERGWT